MSTHLQNRSIDNSSSDNSSSDNGSSDSWSSDSCPSSSESISTLEQQQASNNKQESHAPESSSSKSALPGSPRRTRRRPQPRSHRSATPGSHRSTQRQHQPQEQPRNRRRARQRPQPSPSSAPAKTTDEEDPTWSPSVGAVLEQPPARLPQFLLVGGLVFVTVLGVWSWFGKFDQIGTAPGRLVPQGELYKVHSVEAGKITSLPVEEGDRLQEGDLIAVLDSEMARSEVERLQQVIQNTELQLMQQQQLLNQLQMEVASRRYITDSQVQAQQVAIQQAANEVQTSLSLLAQSQQDLLGYQERIQRLEPLVVEGAIAREFLFQVEQEMRDRGSNVIRNRGSVAQAQTEVEQLKVLLNQRLAEGQRSELESQQRVQSLLVQITELQGRLQENETLLRSAKSRLQQYFLYAPVSGIVSSLNIQNPGEVIQPGQTLLEMRSGEDPLVLEAAITSRDAGFVKPGMPVKVKFDAYPYQKFGVIPGEVVFTSPDSEVDPQLGVIYRIKVKINRNYILSEGEKVEFQAGQTATADVIIRRRRIIDIVLDPIRQLRQNSLPQDEASPAGSDPASSKAAPEP